LPVVGEAPKEGPAGNHRAAGSGAVAHPRVVLAWLMLVILAALAPVLMRLVGHFGR